VNGPLVAIAIMAKAPRAGEVKTRLCPPLTPAEAAVLYRCFLQDKIAQVAALESARGVIAFTPDDSRSEFEALAPSFRLVPQRGHDLGSRLANLLDTLLRDGHAAAIAIDSDTPTLPAVYLRRAVDLLAGSPADLVIGPSEDGGYYLIGMRRAWPALFERMPWSTADVLPETLRRAAAAGLRVECLPPWFDVDTPHDLARLTAALRGADDGPPVQTRRLLKGRGTS
jgi:rSAM/selenodomain-associated transferase 1